MNCLYDMNPDLYNTIAGDGDIDPFYVDSKIPAFLAYISIEQSIIDAAKAYGFDCYFTPSQWIVRGEESNCIFFWSSTSNTNTFWEELQSHFEDVGAQKLFYSVLT